jgi:hypothetical protein
MKKPFMRVSRGPLTIEVSSATTDHTSGGAKSLQVGLTVLPRLRTFVAGKLLDDDFLAVDLALPLLALLQAAQPGT